jgi:hypothetical protein
MTSDQVMQNAYNELYEQAGEINHLSLDESILDQPQKFGHCAAWCAQMTSRRDRLKRDAEVTDARVELRIRAELSKADKDKKPTEATIAAMIKVDQESLDAHNRYFKYKELAQKWDAVLDSFKQRSYALGQYVNWQAGDYIHERIGTAARESAERARSRRMRQ